MNRLQELRIEKGLNKRELAQAVGMKYTTYLGYESGDRGMNSEVLRVFSDFFGVSIDYLIGRAEDREKQTIEEDEVMELRQAMRERPELAFLLKAAKNARTSDVLEASALLQRYKEESEYK